MHVDMQKGNVPVAGRDFGLFNVERAALVEMSEQPDLPRIGAGRQLTEAKPDGYQQLGDSESVTDLFHWMPVEAPSLMIERRKFIDRHRAKVLDAILE